MGAPDVAIPPVSTSDGSTVYIRAFPQEASFARDVRRALGGASPELTEGELLVEMQTRLRRWYPRIAIHPREELASLAAHERVWYVFRDGKVRKENPVADRLHRAMSEARATEDGTRRAIEHAEASLAFAARPRRRRGATALDDPPA